MCFFFSFGPYFDGEVTRQSREGLAVSFMRARRRQDSRERVWQFYSCAHGDGKTG
jgi:hypothetical protein